MLQLKSHSFPWKVSSTCLLDGLEEFEVIFFGVTKPPPPVCRTRHVDLWASTKSVFTGGERASSGWRRFGMRVHRVTENSRYEFVVASVCFHMGGTVKKPLAAHLGVRCLGSSFSLLTGGGVMPPTLIGINKYVVCVEISRRSRNTCHSVTVDPSFQQTGPPVSGHTRPLIVELQPSPRVVGPKHVNGHGLE